MDFSPFFDYPNGSAEEQADHLVFLSEQSEEDWIILLSYMEQRKFSQGEVVLQEGEAERVLYLVIGGNLEVLIPHVKKKWKRISVVEAGSIFGEQGFLDGKPRSATIRALSDGELRQLSWEAFESLSANEPKLALAILYDLARILSHRLRQTTALVSNLK